MITRTPYSMLTSKEIKPSGWLRKQLEIQAKGLCGNLHKIWPDIRDSKWIGGDREGWERVPYWLDGFVPLAYLLEDEELIKVVKKYIDFIIEKQHGPEKGIAWEGWICPVKNIDELNAYDDWAVFLIAKMLIVYYDCSGDERIPDVVEKIVKNMRFRSVHFIPKDWASSRWFEFLITVYWLYERTGEEWMLETVDNLWYNAVDYKKIFGADWKNKKPAYEWQHRGHVVNLAMALKSDALLCRYFNTKGYSTDPDEFAEKMFSLLQEYHGTVTGHFNGDECISGKSPVHGTELCGIVEAMYSYEWLFVLTGKEKWLDRLESITYNSLPAGLSDDMWTRQYDQMSNQIACLKYEEDNTPFMTNGIEGGLFGLETNYGCCTVNFAQGWPKFALSTFVKNDNGISAAAIAPSILNFSKDGADIKITLDTEYPFNNELRYIIEASKPVNFDFEYRIPGCSKGAYVNGEYKGCGMHKISRTWEGTNEINITLNFETEIISRDNDLFSFKRGPLVYSLPIGEKWEPVEYEDENSVRKFPYCDYLISPTTDWQFAFSSTESEFKYNGLSDVPFSSKNPPCELHVKMKPIEWGYKEGLEGLCAREEPVSREAKGESVDKVLYPFGCPKLRMTEIPIIK